MPVYGFPDRRSYNRMARAVRRVESLPGGQRTERIRESRRDRWEYGKLDQAVTAGVLTGGETVTLWLGPGYGANDAAISGVDPIPINYAFDDGASGDYVEVFWKRGMVYVVPTECPE